MATTYKTPGVYVEEIPTLPASVAQVGTAIPAFIGYTEKAQNSEGTDLTDKPTKINSLPEYETFFGGAKSETISVTVIDEESDTTPPTLIDRTITTDISLLPSTCIMPCKCILPTVEALLHRISRRLQ